MYFIAIVPPEPINDEVIAYKNLFAAKYNSKAALKSPPHITLHMPFKLKPIKEEKLMASLKDVASEMESFAIELNGFGQFNERTIFMNIEDNDKLHELFKRLMKTMKTNFNIFNADYKNRGYNPHLTLAFRDLKKEAFREAWPIFRKMSFSGQFETKTFALLKHNGKSWNVFKSFKLRK